MATPSAIPVDPRRDSVVRINRTTRGGRHLWYQLSVLQQPERARACGAGNKANSDRRPVDPPPVVELRIRHGDSWERGKDITFDYNASFFLYASLEQYRKISSGRMGTQQPPILTGVPASGMAYLDRPTAAGYFIFPDLSVRHEGQYRLSFSLFETTKEEIDFDMDPSDGDLPPGVDWRMEIKTNPFDVFSAKKFPGLMESTALSKEVADQGCRVRIRRDVRMRKRETKPRDHDRRDDDYSRRRNPTPANDDPHSARARSMSNSSDQQHGPYGPDRPRRPSAIDTAYPQPIQPAYEAPSNRHLSFGGDSGAPQYAAPPRGYSHHHPPPLAPISPSGPYTPSSQYVKPESQQSSHPPSRNGPPTCQSPAVGHGNHDRRPSGNYIPPSPSVYSSEGHVRHDSQHSSYPPTPVSRYPPSAMFGPQSHPQAPQTQAAAKPSSGSIKIAHLLSGEASSSSEPPLQLRRVESVPQLRHIEPAPQTRHIETAPIGPIFQPRREPGLRLLLPSLAPGETIQPHRNDSALPPIAPDSHYPRSSLTGEKRKRDEVFNESAQPLHNRERPSDHRGLHDDLPKDTREQGFYWRADGSVGEARFKPYALEPAWRP
ncbi:hypothetical protein V2G26_001241 [Clonostachys chloroleuca]